MTALTTYKVAYKALRAASSGCHLRELLHPATQDWASRLNSTACKSALRKSKRISCPSIWLDGMSFHTIGNGADSRIVVKRIKSIRFA